MKKIRQIDEKLLRLVRLYLMDYRIVEKWNKMPKGAKEGIEYAINEVSEILENQEVSQPEENKEIIKINRKLYSEILQMIFLLEEKLQSGDVYGANKVLGMFSSTTAEFILSFCN